MKIPAKISAAYEKAKAVRLKAHAPYSKFQVGAALMGGGAVETGCNVENASYGGTVCAERIAIFKAVSEGRKSFSDIVIVTDAPEPAFPCAFCLQVMAEFFDPKTQIWLGDLREIRSVHEFGELLPYPFGPKQLGDARSAAGATVGKIRTPQVNLKEWLIFAYGVIFATSTPYLKPKKRYLFPTATWRFDDAFTLFLGGSGICACLRAGTEVLLVNTNLDAAALQWRADLEKLGGYFGATLVMNSLNGSFGDAEEIAAMSPSVVMSFETVPDEKVLSVGDETVRLIPVASGPTETDLVVFFEKRSVMMFGSLFVNRIHPVLQMGVAARAPSWISSLEDLIARFQPRVCVPGEGDVGTIEDVREFIRYLRSLTDESVEFSFCRKNFDWMEIPRFTSLEENFDILRRNVKTHASIR